MERPKRNVSKISYDEESILITSQPSNTTRLNKKSNQSKSEPSQVRKSQRTSKTKKIDYAVPNSDDELSDNIIKSSGSQEEGSDSDSDSDHDDFQHRIQFILGKQILSSSEWRNICDKMNTREVIRGSAWKQPDDEYFSSSPQVIEKFLIKWTHSSFLHVSWETEKDLLELAGKSAKQHLKRFRSRESTFTTKLWPDLGPGEYFPPSFTSLERVLDLDSVSGPFEISTIDWKTASLPSPSLPLPSALSHSDSPSSRSSTPVSLSLPPDCHVLSPESNSLLSISSLSEPVTLPPSSLSFPFSSVFSERERKEGEVEEEGEGEGISGASMEDGEEEEEMLLLDLDFEDLPSLPLQRHEGKSDPSHPSNPSLPANPNSLCPLDCWLLVKWEGLPYGDITDEHLSDLLAAGVRLEGPLRAFLRREQLPPIRRLTRKTQRKLSPALQGDCPPLSGGTLRPYQWEGVRWLLFNWTQGRNSILADEMGLGKTIQSATFLHLLRTEQGCRGPFLIVAPLSTIVNWQREILNWTEMDCVLYYGSQEDRRLIREFEFSFSKKDVSHGSKIEIVITTPEALVLEEGRGRRLLAQIQWEMVVVDEAHKMKNYESKLCSTLREDFSFLNCLLLTGTPLQNNTDELWTLLNFVDRERFASQEHFSDQFGDLKTAHQLESLRESLKPYLLKREKTHVERTIPLKQEVLVEVEMTVPQKQYYRAIYEQKTGFLFRDGAKDGPSLSNLAMELRKCCNHPFLVKGAEKQLAQHFQGLSPLEMLTQSCGKMILLDKLLPRLWADGHRVLIFSQFRIMLNIIEDYLDLKGFSYERVDGAVTGRNRQLAIDRYTRSGPSQNKEDIFAMLLSTRAGGVGINLTAADTVIIYDSDWNPQNDLQAQARAHRIGQTKPVTVYRLITTKSYEMAMFQAASIKLGLDYAVLHDMAGVSSTRAEHVSSLSKRELETLLKHGAYSLFKEESEGQSNENSKKFCEDNLDEILSRCSKVSHSPEPSSPSSTVLGSFSKAAFVSNSGEQSISIDDPDFWSKVVGLTVSEEASQLGTRKCRLAVSSYKEPSMRIEQPLQSEEESEEESQPVEFSQSNLHSLQLSLTRRGFGQWAALGEDSRLFWPDMDTARGCLLSVLLLVFLSCLEIKDIDPSPSLSSLSSLWGPDSLSLLNSLVREFKIASVVLSTSLRTSLDPSQPSDPWLSFDLPLDLPEMVKSAFSLPSTDLSSFPLIFRPENSLQLSEQQLPLILHSLLPHLRSHLLPFPLDAIRLSKLRSSSRSRLSSIDDIFQIHLLASFSLPAPELNREDQPAPPVPSKTLEQFLSSLIDIENGFSPAQSASLILAVDSIGWPEGKKIFKNLLSFLSDSGELFIQSEEPKTVLKKLKSLLQILRKRFSPKPDPAPPKQQEFDVETRRRKLFPAIIKTLQKHGAPIDSLHQPPDMPFDIDEIQVAFDSAKFVSLCRQEVSGHLPPDQEPSESEWILQTCNSILNCEEQTLKETTFPVEVTWKQTELCQERVLIFKELRAVLLCLDQKELLDLIPKSIKSCDPALPPYKRDPSMPVWWNPRYDQRLLLLFADKGWNPKLIILESSLSPPCDFVVPNRIQNTEWILQLTTKSLEDRFFNLIQALQIHTHDWTDLALPTDITLINRKTHSKAKKKTNNVILPLIGSRPSWVTNMFPSNSKPNPSLPIMEILDENEPKENPLTPISIAPLPCIPSSPIPIDLDSTVVDSKPNSKSKTPSKTKPPPKAQGGILSFFQKKT